VTLDARDPPLKSLQDDGRGTSASARPPSASVRSSWNAAS